MNFARSFSLVVALFIAGVLLVHRPGTAQAALDKSSMELVNKAVFEVIVLKPTHDSLTYERPLPLDLLPYSERTDKYIPVGTAFAISPTEFISAAHVLSLDHESQFKEYFIRDASGNVFPVDQILKYSDRRDFVVFSVKGRPAGDFLPINRKPELNGKVYAVGNALGEGVVIRDGLYTSNTPEDFTGEWKWLRFSAAASPGNSGGPLLDEKGAVIGIVLQKSPSENLNIALPISEVITSRIGVAEIYKKMLYFLDNMSFTKIDVLQDNIALPLAYRPLNDQITASVEKFGARLLSQLLAENRDRIFPNGKESTALFYKNVDATFPHLISRGSDGNWDVQAPKDTKEADLGGNGLMTLGGMGNSLYLYVQKPDTIPLATFYKDSKVFMDTILKGVNVTRQVGVDKIKITSLGKAESESEYVDAYQRKWLVRIWNMEYNDERIVTFSLPVPGGCVTLMRGGSTGRSNGHLMDLKALSDFIYVSYYGSLKQWREFLAMKELLPQAFSTIDISFDYGRRLAYKSARVALQVEPKNMRITENSDLRLDFGFFKEKGKTVWDVKEITVGEDKNSVNYFVLARNMRPPTELGDKFKSEWDKLVGKKMPYNKVAFVQDKSTVIEAPFTRNIPAKRLAGVDVLYHVGYMREGTRGQKEMAAGLDAFLKGIKVFEDGKKQ
ncbi:MAG TPA: serine protease [Geobacteraceae bacterium]